MGINIGNVDPLCKGYMKNKILILFLFLICTFLQAQNTISLILQPIDLGLGLRYDHQIRDISIYTSVSKGHYKDVKHIKTSLGVSHCLKTGPYISIAATYHNYTNKSDVLPEKVYNPISFDFGSGFKFKRVMIGFIYDPLKREGGLNFGIII